MLLAVRTRLVSRAGAIIDGDESIAGHPCWRVKAPIRGQARPMLVVIDKAGIVRAVVGAVDSKQLDALVARLLG